MKVWKVLLIDADEQHRRMISMMISGVFGEDTEIITATSLEEAEKLHDAHADVLDIIFIDTYLERKDPSYDLAARIAAGKFDGPLIATSTDAIARKKMMERGCTHQCEKGEVMKFLRKWKLAQEA